MYKTMYFFYCIWLFPCTSYVFSACFMDISCKSVYSSHLVCISCRFQTKYSFSPSGRANFRPLTIVWTEIDISSEQHCFEILQRIISTLFLSAEQNCLDKLKNIFSTLLLACYHAKILPNVVNRVQNRKSSIHLSFIIKSRGAPKIVDEQPFFHLTI